MTKQPSGPAAHGNTVAFPFWQVPVDICVRPETRAVIITGPNTGGKTAALKALGLAVLMARAGLAPPAAHPVRLPPFPQVLPSLRFVYSPCGAGQLD